MDETPKKRPVKPFKGVVDGKSFTKYNQPTPEQKKAGWEQWRKERHLTQTILKELLGEDGKPTMKLSEYVQSLFNNAKEGNPKAIDTINKCLEDDIVKVANVDTEGNPITGPFKVEIVKPTE